LLKNSLIILIPVILFQIAGGIYYLNGTKVFQVSASCLLFRQTEQESDKYPRPISKNRWIWIRDGLTIKEAILSDKFLLENIISLKEYHRRFNSKKHNNSTIPLEDRKLNYIKQIKNSIDIVYSGGDSNRYSIRVKDSDPAVAKKTTKLILDRIKELNLKLTKNSSLFEVIEH